LHDDDFVFLTMFDFNSSAARKNPLAAIEAFKLAFPQGDERACLLLKSSNGDRSTAQLMRLVEASAGDARIIIRDDLIDRADLQALQRCCDAYLSLHRSEGFGLVMAETMLMGKPVIATAYSGNLEFMNSQNSCLVDYDLVQVEAGEYPMAEGQYWAAPHVHHAAEHMRALFGNRALCEKLGAQAAVDMADYHSPARCLSTLGERLRVIDAARLARAGAADGQRVDDIAPIAEPLSTLTGINRTIEELN
jgi:glycosyltransferase involved in cell wall biosynthesis